MTQRELEEKNTTKVLHISQSVNKIDVSGSIIPTDNNVFS